MRKLLILVFAIISMFASAQEALPLFDVNDKSITVGVGRSSTLFGTTTLPPLSIKLEKGIVDDLGGGILGAGLYLGASATEVNRGFNDNPYGDNYFYTILGAIGSYHYPFINNVDTYVSLMLAYNIVSSSTFDSGRDGLDYLGTPIAPYVSWYWKIGATYYFADKFGLMGEMGYGVSRLTIGLTYKL